MKEGASPERESPMLARWRNPSRPFSVLIFLLVLAFAAQELPEFFSLSDDPSNDAIIAARSGKTVLPGPDQRRPKSAPDNSFSVEITEKLSFVSPPVSPAFESPTRAGQDLLHLLSVQRK